MTESGGFPLTDILGLTADDRTIETQAGKDIDMHKLFIGLMVILFLGDPSLQSLAWLGEMKTYLVAATIALVSLPFVVSQIDG